MIEPQLLVGLDYNIHLALNAGYFTFSLYGRLATSLGIILAFTIGFHRYK